MSALPDPVREGFVTSLARPGGNTTGMTLDAAELGGKQLELLKEAVSTLSRVGVLRNPTSPDWPVAKEILQTSARSLALTIHDFPITRAEDLAPAFAAMGRARLGALLVRRDVLVIERHQTEVVRLAAQQRLPAIYNFRDFTEAGGLMSYGVNVSRSTSARRPSLTRFSGEKDPPSYPSSSRRSSNSSSTSKPPRLSASRSRRRCWRGRTRSSSSGPSPLLGDVAGWCHDRAARR
jgi:putative tryptophan/tyrosine transport system substrate-binding protein